MNKNVLIVLIACLMLVAFVYQRGYWENSASILKKNIGRIDELKVFALPNKGEEPLLSTQNPVVIQGFLEAIEFKRFSQVRAISIKMPGVLEFETVGASTQRLQWVACGWGYLRADNGLLYGDVELTKASSQQLANWLKKHGVAEPERNHPLKFRAF